jgi:hypothetical protein
MAIMVIGILFCSMNRRDNADEEIEADPIALLQPGREHFRPDARDPHLAVGLVGELVVHVVRQLAVNADGLHSMKHRVATALQHERIGYRVPVPMSSTPSP